MVRNALDDVDLPCPRVAVADATFASLVVTTPVTENENPAQEFRLALLALPMALDHIEGPVEEEEESEGVVRRPNVSGWTLFKYRVSSVFRPRPYTYGKLDTIKKLPSRRRRHWAWKYEFVRPWEPQPPRNYLQLLHLENPWMLNPPSKFGMVVWLALFFVINFAAGFASIALNASVISDRLNKVDTRFFIFPAWFHVLFLVVAHLASTIASWFVYLTGGVVKHFITLLPFFGFLVMDAIWPDILFSVRSILGATIILCVGTILCLVSMVAFCRHIVFSGILLVFLLIVNIYEVVNCLNMCIVTGTSY